MARSLLPREHGTYFQLAVPLVAVWLRVAATPAAIALTIASVLAFLAHEPLSIAIGGRGARLRDSDGRRARIRLAVLAVPALACGIAGLVLAPLATLVAAIPVALVAGAVVALAPRRAVHTLSGELLAVVALTGASAVVATGAGIGLAAALAQWAAWAVGFGATVACVHRVLARRSEAQREQIDGIAVALFSLVVVLTMLPGIVTASIIAIPLVAAAVTTIVIAPSPKRIRSVGVMIAAVALVSVALPPW